MLTFAKRSCCNSACSETANCVLHEARYIVFFIIRVFFVPFLLWPNIVSALWILSQLMLGNDGITFVSYMLELYDISSWDDLLYRVAGVVVCIITNCRCVLLFIGCVSVVGMLRGWSVVTLRISHLPASSWPTYSLGCPVENVVDFSGIHFIYDFLRFFGFRSGSSALLPNLDIVWLTKWTHHRIVEKWCLTFARCLDFFKGSFQPISILLFIFLSAIAQSKELCKLGNVSNFLAFCFRLALVLRVHCYLRPVVLNLALVLTQHVSWSLSLKSWHFNFKFCLI